MSMQATVNTAAYTRLPKHTLSITGAVRPVTATSSGLVNGQINALPFADEHHVRTWSPPV